MIKNVVLEVLASNQKNRLLEEAGSGPAEQEASPSPSLLQGEAELAYLTHEGLFISDALNEAQQQQQAGQDQNSRIQQSRVEAAGSATASGTTETSVSREQSFMYVTEGCPALILSLVGLQLQKTRLHRLFRRWRYYEHLEGFYIHSLEFIYFSFNSENTRDKF